MIAAENESMKTVNQETESKDEDGNNLQSTTTSVLKLPPHLPKNASQFRIFVYEVTESKVFGGSILCVISLNTLMLIAQTREEALMKRGDTRAYFPS